MAPTAWSRPAWCCAGKYTLASYEQLALGYLAVVRKEDGALIGRCGSMDMVVDGQPRHPSTGFAEDRFGREAGARRGPRLSLSRGREWWRCRPRFPLRQPASTTRERTLRAPCGRQRRAPPRCEPPPARTAPIWRRGSRRRRRRAALHLLEPESRPPTARIHQVLGGTVAARLISQRGAPERHHLGGRVRTRDDEQALNRRRVGSRPNRRAAAEIRRAISTSRWLTP